MKKKYITLYKRLIKAFYLGTFEKEANKICSEEFEDENEAKAVLSGLCGVDIEPCDNNHTLSVRLLESITKGKVRAKIIQKVHSCTGDCQNKENCQSVCPFNAITKDGFENKIWIDESLCFGCGLCESACEHGNYLSTKEFLPIASMIKNGEKVIAIVAPAIAGQFGDEVTLDMLRAALISLGFKDMIEVALAADILSLKEALEFDHHVSGKDDFMITSCCCPMWVGALNKVYHKLIKDVSPSVSPMVAMGRIIKKLDSSAKVVFIGPCIAKKTEARMDDIKDAIDFVLTFEELKIIFDALDINPQSMEGVPSVDYASTCGRMYAVSGGVSEAVENIVKRLFPEKHKIFSTHCANGMPECKELLAKMQEGFIPATFIEGMGCRGGCVGGPKVLIDKEDGRRLAIRQAKETEIEIPVFSEVLTRILDKLGFEDFEFLTNDTSIFERKFD